MEENTENKIEIREKIINFYNKNKLKIFFLAGAVLLFFIFIIFLNINKNQKNNLIAEKYIQANIFLSSNKEEDAKILLNEIILSENEFYSILALNIIIDKNLEKKKDTILNYFKSIEKMNISGEKRDLIIFKKALYLLKYSDGDEGKKLLQNLIKSNSSLKILAEEIIAK
tara:strand:- start:2404 stop:2913 length:510 start_codon:yes stop_codon:yes gene_type:complete